MKNSFTYLVAVFLLSACATPTPFATLSPIATSVKETLPNPWREDLHYLAQALRDHHPNPFYRASSIEFDQLVTRLDQKIPTLTREQTIVEFIRLTALIDGHTQIPIYQSAIDFHFYPLRLYQFEDGLYVINAAPPFAEAIGARLISVGDQEAAKVWGQLAPLASHDNEMGLRLNTPLYHVMPEVLQALGIIDDLKRPHFIVEKPNGERLTLNPTPISYQEFQQLNGNVIFGLPAQNPPLYLSRRFEAFWFTFLPDTQTLFIQYNQVRAVTQSGESLQDFTTRLAEFVKTNPVRQVVVDMRLNGGGDNTTYFSMLDLLTRNETINQPHKLFVIIGRVTFSAAANFITELESHSQAIFVGEPSGGSPNLYGDTRPFTLPHSKIVVNISSRYWQKSTPNDKRPWVTPQLATPLSAQDFFQQRDPALEAIFKYSSIKNP